MKPEKLSDIKKELASRTPQELIDTCLRLAKYKKENKELLNYLLFDSGDPMLYAENIKTFLIPEFESLQRGSYYSTKGLRKILRVMNRHVKYTASKQVETELILWFTEQYLKYVDLRSSHKALQQILLRQFDKVSKLLPKLHEDLQFDYKSEFERILKHAESQTRWVQRKAYV